MNLSWVSALVRDEFAYRRSLADFYNESQFLFFGLVAVWFMEVSHSPLPASALAALPYYLFSSPRLHMQYDVSFCAGKKFSGRPMCTLLTNKRYELLYNCGIQLLHIGRPLAAFECLIEAVQVYHSNPRLWLRIAECCIAANKGVSRSARSFCWLALWNACDHRE